MHKTGPGYPLYIGGEECPQPVPAEPLSVQFNPGNQQGPTPSSPQTTANYIKGCDGVCFGINRSFC